MLDPTPFYAEGGGQVGDRGVLRDAGTGELLFTVEDTQRAGRRAGRPSRQAPRPDRASGRQSRAEVDAERRAGTMRNHTGTHVLHRALRNTVGRAGAPGRARS